MEHEKFICVICEKEVAEFGCNPEPLKTNGKCCKQCNQDKVIPTRLKNIFGL